VAIVIIIKILTRCMSALNHVKQIPIDKRMFVD